MRPLNSQNETIVCGSSFHIFCLVIQKSQKAQKHSVVTNSSHLWLPGPVQKIAITRDHLNVLQDTPETTDYSLWIFFVHMLGYPEIQKSPKT
jgi:hypothetical protein